MIKRLISFLLTLVLFIAIPLEARYRYNPYTRKLDWYEAAADVDLGDLGDITLTGLANGDILYYNGTAWVNLVAGANTNVLTLAAGIPSWAAPGAPAAHAPTHLAAGADPVDHDQLLNYLAAQHLTLPNTLVAVLTDHNAAAHVALGFLALPSTIAAVLTDHNLLAHTALGLFDQSSDVDHDATTNYLAAQHLTLPSTIVAVLTDHNLAAHTALGLYDAPGDVDHNLTTNYAANQHVVLPATIAAVLTDHDLAAHTALGLFDASGDVDHDATTNWVANKHINWTAAASNFSTSENFTLAWDDAADYAEIVQMNAAGIANRPLININDDRTGVTADTVGEATIVMNAAGTYAFYVQTGAVQFDGAFEVLNVFSYDYTTDHNLFFGYLAGTDITATSGQYNTFVGEGSGENVTTGDNNAFFGYHSGYNILTGASNVAIGYEAGLGKVANNWSFNTLVGYRAGYQLENNANNNTMVGFEAGYNEKTGSHNVYVGYQAGYSANPNGGASYNVFMGYQSGYSLVVGGDSNTVIGKKAGYALTTGDGNVIMGSEAGYFNDLGGNNVLLGGFAGHGTTGEDFSHNVVIGYAAGEDLSTGSDNIIIGYYAGEGWMDTEGEKLVIDVTDTTTPLIYGDFSADNITINGDFSVLMDAALDQILFQQSAVAGTEDQPLIFIDDDRIGVTAQEQGEATIVIDADGVYALHVADGNTSLLTTYMYAASGMKADDALWSYGAGDDFLMKWDLNGTGGDMMTWSPNLSGAATAALFYSEWPLNPNNMTDHDGYLSPTFVIANALGADANDYAGVVIGERAQANVKIAHYFDFYAMTGAADGSVDTADELAAIFRFGASGSATPGYSTTGGDVLLEGSLEIDGNQQNAGYNRYDYIYWIESFDHGIAANRYSQMWDITSLNTQGNGTNTIDTTPSHITLTTDNNAIGDNEGTITYKQIILRSRLNRSEFSVDLGQTANTQFYCGWNTSQTNAMVAAADEYVIVFFDVSDNANWQIKVGDGATEDVFTSAVAGDTNEIRHEIWVEADGTVHWRVNGTELDITGSVDNLMTANGHYLIVCQAQSVTGAAAIVAEMCYVENEKTKAN